MFTPEGFGERLVRTTAFSVGGEGLRVSLSASGHHALSTQPSQSWCLALGLRHPSVPGPSSKSVIKILVEQDSSVVELPSYCRTRKKGSHDGVRYYGTHGERQERYK